MGVVPRALASRRGSMQAVQVCPADLAEPQEWIGIKTPRQRLGRELPRLHAWLQRNLNDRPEHGLRCGDDIGGSKEPHSVDEADEALLVAAEFDLVPGVGAQKQVR